MPSYTPSTEEPAAHSGRLWRQLHLALNPNPSPNPNPNLTLTLTLTLPLTRTLTLTRQLHLALLDSAPTAPLVRAAAPGLADLAPSLRMGLR